MSQLRTPRRRGAVPFAGIALTTLAFFAFTGARASAQEDTTPPIKYTTVFTTPPLFGEDRTVEQYVLDRINEAKPGSKIGFAVRDWTVQSIATALINAYDRGVDITGVIDGGERNRPFLQQLVAHLNGGAIFCGSPTFEFNSCISEVFKPGLMHNKFWLFSELPDGSSDVVIQTSQNWTPAQRSAFQDLVRIDGDTGLYQGYWAYLNAMHAQARSDNYVPDHTDGDDKRNTMYPMPHEQANIWTDDVVVDRLKEIDCSEGGSASGTGLVQAAQVFFRSPRMVIADELVELERQGCDVQVVNSNGDPEIVAKLVNAGVAYYPFFLGTGGITTHTKYWLVDAKSSIDGTRKKIVYAGSDNWRAREQQTDDMLLRVVNDGVYAAYAGHWEVMRSRSSYTRSRAPSLLNDTESPATAISATGANASNVVVRVTGSDGVGGLGGDEGTIPVTGVKRLHVDLSGARTSSSIFPESADAPAYTVALTGTVSVSQPGTTIVRAWAEDHKGNIGPVTSYVVVNGQEGSTLSAAGSFAVADAPPEITKVSGEGAVDDNGDGTWTWTYTPPDDGSGKVVVQASDGHDRRDVEELYWTAANVAPVIDDLALTIPPGPACQGPTNRVSASFAVNDPADEVHDPVTGSIDWGDGNTTAIAGRLTESAHDYAPGVYSLTVSVADDDGGTDRAGSPGNVAVLYAMSPILPPMNADGSSIWRFGATIPLKVEITDCAGTPVPDLSPTVASQRRSGSEPVGPVNEAASTTAADTGNTMRFDALAGQYVYNFATRSLSDPTGTYFIYVREPHSLGSDPSGIPTIGASSQKFGLK